jgi:hypothetical protein
VSPIVAALDQVEVDVGALAAAIAEYAHNAGQAVLAVLGVGTVVPHESAMRRVLQNIDAAALEAAVRARPVNSPRGRHSTPRAAARARPGRQDPARRAHPQRPRGHHGLHRRPPMSLTPAAPRTPTPRRAPAGGALVRPHLVSVLDQTSGVVLGQLQVDTTGGEVAAFTTLLDPPDLTGVLVTADALHTHRGMPTTCTPVVATT